MTNETTIAPELLDQLLSNYKSPQDLLGEDGLFKNLKKALIERALGAELTEHLGYQPFDKLRRRSGWPRQRQQPEWRWHQDDFDRRRRERDRGAERSRGKLRTAIDPQRANKVRRL